MINFEETKKMLEENGQEHLLHFYNELNDEQKQRLLKQIYQIDYKQTKELFSKKIDDKQDEISQISYTDKEKLADADKTEYLSIGKTAISDGKLAAVTMAGGQGTRLGHAGPKGTFVLDEKEGKTLFEILCDTLKQAKEEYGVYVPWYIMTSKENNDDTVKYFEDNNYLDYPKDKIKFFIQGELPMLDINGKIVLETKFKVKEAADGHGGIFEAMHKNGVIEDMKEKGIKWVFIGGVDNVLVKMVDPILIGMSEKGNYQVAGKSLVKANPQEKVGVFCKRNGKPSVIEYSEISPELAEKKDENGELCYGEAHILCNMFGIDALNEIGKDKLPYHSAFKKCNYLGLDGNEIVATEPNAYKYEAFIFDAFERVENMLILRVKREDEFAPVKNAEGVDSPETARELYNNYWKNKKI